MVFPAVWAAAMVGTHTNIHAATVIAIAASIGIPARLRRRILGHLPFCVSEACLAQRERGWKPIWRRQIAGTTRHREREARRSGGPGNPSRRSHFLGDDGEFRQ